MNFQAYPTYFPNDPPPKVEVAAFEVWMRHHKKKRPGLAEVTARLEELGKKGVGS